MTNDESGHRPSRYPANLNFSRHFKSWLTGFNASIAFTTYQAGKVIMIGIGGQGISITERSVP